MLKTSLPRIVGLALLLSGHASLVAADVVVNGSFESNQGSGRPPRAWVVQGAGSGVTVSVSNGHTRSGQWSVRVAGRAEATDGLRQDVRAALTAGGNGAHDVVRGWVRLDDFASVRMLLRYADDTGARADLILAERVVLTPQQWVELSGTSVVSWTGSLRSASLVFEVRQQGRESATPVTRLLPDYYVDDVTMEPDADGDGIADQDESALGMSATRADTDGDGLPDLWERDHQFSPAFNEAAQDTDGDGFSNWQELGAATDPRDATSYPGKPANPNMNASARAVLRWLALLPSQTTGGHLAAGQMVSDLGTTSEYSSMIDDLGRSTGRYPAILSMAIEPVFDRHGIPLQMAEVESRTLDYWRAGGLVLMKWAIYNPWVVLNGNNQTGVDIAGLLSPSRSAPDARQANQVAHDNLVSWMTTVGDSLARLQQQGVVVMFRPMSEMNGDWFWWGHRERSEYVALWTFLYDYFTTTRGLNNLIWMYEADSSTHAPVVAGGDSAAGDYYYPGDEATDVLGHNLYSNSWVLAWDSNAVFARHPKVFGIPQAGPGRLPRDGTFDNLTYVARSEAALPRSSFFVVWNSFMGTEPETGKQRPIRVGIFDNLNAFELMTHPSIVTRESLPASLFSIGGAQAP